MFLLTNPHHNKKAILAWCFFDWANSAFPTLILTFIFAHYFTQSVAKEVIRGTAQWGYALALSGVVVALISPFVGAIADHQGHRKPGLGLFTLICIVSSALLGYTHPIPKDTEWALAWLVTANIGFEMGMVFYNAMLSHLVMPAYLGRLSGWSWGFGYLGGLTSLGLMLFLFSGIPGISPRFTGPFVALWMITFAWPLFVWTPDRKAASLSYYQAIQKGALSLWSTLKNLKKHREVFKLLIARLFYIDGLNTIFVFGGIYAAESLHLSPVDMLQFGITLNAAAGLGALLFAWIDDCRGTKFTLLLGLLIAIICSSALLIVQSKVMFWTYAIGFSLCVGPIQAASRSLLIRLSNPLMITEMFGLFAFSGKITAFLGPWMLAFLSVIYHSQRIGLLSVIILLVIGASLLTLVKEKHTDWAASS